MGSGGDGVRISPLFNILIYIDIIISEFHCYHTTYHIRCVSALPANEKCSS